MLKTSLGSLLILVSFFFGHSSTATAQNNIKPCATNDVQCQFDQQQNNQRENPQIDYRTPQQIQERRVDTAATTCDDSNSATCQKIDSRLSDPNLQNTNLRELQQQRLNQQFN